MRKTITTVCCSICIILFSIAASGEALKSPVAPANESVDKIYDVTTLNGDWKVVSTTWGGDQKSFVGQIYRINIIDHVKSSDRYKDEKGGLTLFTASVESRLENGKDFFDFDPSNMDLVFCVMRYEELENSYKFMYGFSGLPEDLGFEKYNCGQAPNEAEHHADRKNLEISRFKQLLRLNLTGHNKAHVLVYYELSSIATTEFKDKSPEDNYGYTRCSSDICLNDAMPFFGVFELEFERVAELNNSIEPTKAVK